MKFRAAVETAIHICVLFGQYSNWRSYWSRRPRIVTDGLKHVPVGAVMVMKEDYCGPEEHSMRRKVLKPSRQGMGDHF